MRFTWRGWSELVSSFFLYEFDKFHDVTTYSKVRNERITRGMNDAKYEEFCKARYKKTQHVAKYLLSGGHIKSRCITQR